jgi:hypothetical protein
VHRPHRPHSTGDDDRGEMLLVMVALTAVLLGLAGVLTLMLARPSSPPSGDLNQDVTLSAAGEWRDQALAAGLSAGPAADGDRLDQGRICAAATDAASAYGAQVLSCRLDADGLTVVTAGSDASDPQTSTALLGDDDGGCLTIETSWLETLPARCPSSAEIQG